MLRGEGRLLGALMANECWLTPTPRKHTGYKPPSSLALAPPPPQSMSVRTVIVLITRSCPSKPYLVKGFSRGVKRRGVCVCVCVCAQDEPREPFLSPPPSPPARGVRLSEPPWWPTRGIDRKVQACDSREKPAGKRRVGKESSANATLPGTDISSLPPLLATRPPLRKACSL
ncbi:hypothetical protein LX32DRAFT_376169 [Colletotrichum zoysiae]|uniref:Uncharacterized protein n=1 Tax=Colletotrichum zoysiae TaxID=1216348 RepID=A0AAD9M1H4_9PEZI|nr:hypothetical protein LX32DRAFT_376169 [Colletotrichum zoysiae]